MTPSVEYTMPKKSLGVLEGNIIFWNIDVFITIVPDGAGDAGIPCTDEVVVVAVLEAIGKEDVPSA